MDDKITLVTFTDPMMGLSYECEPIFRKLETHFPNKIDFHYVMSLLVRNVYDFVDPDDLKRGKNVAIKTGLDTKKFLAHYNDGSAEKNLQSDLLTCKKLGIHSLPSYLIQYKSQGALVQNLIGYETFAQIFSDLSGGLIKPVPPQKNIATLQELLRKHPLISSIELREAFDFSDTAQIRNFIVPLLDSGEIKLINVPRGYFIQKI